MLFMQASIIERLACYESTFRVPRSNILNKMQRGSPEGATGACSSLHAMYSPSIYGSQLLPTVSGLLSL